MPTSEEADVQLPMEFAVPALPEDDLALAQLIARRLAVGRAEALPAGRVVRHASRAAYAAFTAAPRSIRLAVEIVRLLEDVGPMTDYQLWELLADGEYQPLEEGDVAKVRSNLTTLAKPPLIRDSGATGLSRRGNPAVKWQVCA